MTLEELDRWVEGDEVEQAPVEMRVVGTSRRSARIFTNRKFRADRGARTVTDWRDERHVWLTCKEGTARKVVRR